jgi:energy-coupling factor transporter ATP-binding protein EcfA2
LKLEDVLALCIEDGDCLLWQGTMGTGKNKATPHLNFIAPDGTRGRLMMARTTWEARNGRPVPAGKIVYRTCCNERCLEHLKLGVRGDAHRQRKRLGLTGHSPATIAALTIGARNREGIVCSIETAREVRALLYSGLRNIDVSRRTGVDESTVSCIKRGKAWAESLPAASVFSWGGQ